MSVARLRLPWTRANARRAGGVELPRAAYWIAAAGCYVVLTLAIPAYFTSLTIADDAYMFVRYADNVLNYGVVPILAAEIEASPHFKLVNHGNDAWVFEFVDTQGSR